MAPLRMLPQEKPEDIESIGITGTWMVKEQERGELKLMMSNDKPNVAIKLETAK